MNKLLNGQLDTQHPIDGSAKVFLDKLHEAIRKNIEIMSYHVADIPHLPIDDLEGLLLELQLEQIKLVMQNEKLNQENLKLTASRDNYAQLYNLSPVSHLVLNKSGIIQRANASASILLGSPKKELINKNLEIFIHPSDQENFSLFFAYLLAPQKNQVINAKFNNTDTKNTLQECHFFKLSNNNKLHTYVECRANIIYNNKNKLRIYLTLNELPGKQATTSPGLLNKIEKELQRAKPLLDNRNIKSDMSASEQGIVIIDSSNIIIYANATANALFGFQEEELVGCNIQTYLPSLTNAINNCCDEMPVKYDCQIRVIEGIHKNGAVVYLKLSITGFSIENQYFFIYIMRDCSTVHNQQTQEQLDKLAHVTRLGLMGEMASGIIHELTQPLCAITNYVQVSMSILSTNNPDIAQLNEIVQKTQHQASRAGKLIHHMREFAKTHSNHRSSTEINALIHDAINLCIAELKQNSVKMKLELEINPPPVFVDRILIEQVLINLIRNSIDALKNSPHREQRVISIHSRLTDNDEMLIRLKDNGQGLDEDQQQKILTPFYTTKEYGMGMGLSLSRSLIEAHEGTLYFNSLPEKGTTFYFTLPIAKNSARR